MHAGLKLGHIENRLGAWDKRDEEMSDALFFFGYTCMYVELHTCIQCNATNIHIT